MRELVGRIAVHGNPFIPKLRQGIRVGKACKVTLHDLAKLLYARSGRGVVGMGCAIHTITSWAALAITGI